MPYPILGTPKPQFFDSSGSPLASGTLSVLDPADDTNKASYPTYDDAVAATNANTNPLTLDSRGEPSSGLWGLDGEDYKLVLKDSGGTTVWTQDDVRVPIILPYLQTAAEAAAGVTPTNLQYEPGDVRRYGADGSGDETQALVDAIDAMSGGGVVSIPLNTMTVSSIDVDDNVELRGLGRAETTITVTGYGTDGDTSAKYGVRLLGLAADGLSAAPKLTGMEIVLTTATASVHGILVRRKPILTDVYVRGATGDGIYFDTDVSTNASFFGRLTDVWSKNNTGNGCNVRGGANANMFINCQFDNNGGYGFIHQTDGTSTYGNIIIGGQASYNSDRGYDLDSGTNLTLIGCYSELNGDGLSETDWATSTAYTTGQLVTSPSSGLTTAQTSVVYQAVSNHTSDSSSFETDYAAGLWEPYGTALRVSNSVTYSSIQMGTVLSSKTHLIRNESTQITTLVYLGGRPIKLKNNTPHYVESVRFRDGITCGQNSGSTDNIYEVGAGGSFRQVFKEAGVTQGQLGIVYDGSNAAPSNQLILRSLDINGADGGEYDLITLQQNSRMAFFGASPVTQQSHIADPSGGATQDAEARTAINAILVVLESLGFTATS